MPLSRHAIKAFSVALLVLSLTVVASAQSIATLKEKAASGDADAQFDWAGFTTTAKAYRRITHRRRLGIARQQSRAMQPRNPTSV